MRLLIAAAVTASLFATNLLAAETNAPLPAGKPAGVQKAQDGSDMTWWYIGLGVLAAGAIVAGSSGNSSVPVTAPPTTS